MCDVAEEVGVSVGSGPAASGPKVHTIDID